MRTVSWMSLLAGLVLAGCGHGEMADWNSQTGAELKTKIEQMFKDIDSGNFAGLKLWADRDVVVFDFDENNVPVTARGTEGLDKYLAAYDAAVRKGLSLKTTISRDDCFGDSDMGFCTVEFDQTVGQGGQTTAPFKFRGTLVARRAKDGWRWVHWHGSFREFPPSPAAGAPASAPPATSPGAEGAAPAANEQAPPK